MVALTPYSYFPLQNRWKLQKRTIASGRDLDLKLDFLPFLPAITPITLSVKDWIYRTHGTHRNSRGHGLIDSLGNIVLPPVYSIIYPEDKLFITIKGDTSELRDIHLKLQFASTEYRLQPSYYHSNHVDIIKGDRCGLMDSSGKIVVPCDYDMLVGSFNEYGLADVRQQGKHGFVNRKGKQVIPCEYQSVGKFSEGLIDVRKNEKWGYIDTLGRTVIPFRYEIGIWFEEGLARVAKRDEAGYHFGYINTSGDEVIPLIYSNAKDFRDGFAEVELNGKWIKIDRNGNRK
jgi:hypothetical protein